MPKHIMLDDWNEIVIRFSPDTALKAAVKEIPSAHYDFYTHGGWLVWPDLDNLAAVQALAQRFEIDLPRELRLPVSALMDRFWQARYQLSRTTSAAIPPIPGLDGRLAPFQQAGMLYAVHTMRCLIADEQPDDRMAIALAALQAVKAFPALIVCQSSAVDEWLRQCARWLKDRPVDVLKKVPGPVAEKGVRILPYSLLSDGPFAHWSSYAQWAKAGLFGIVFDDSHLLKSADSLRTERAQALARGIHYRYMLSATPIINWPAELVSQLDLLERLPEFGGKERFYERYCQGTRDGAEHLDDLHQRLRSNCLLRRAPDWVLPVERRYAFINLANYQAYRRARVNAAHWQAPDRYGNPLLELGRQKLPYLKRWLRTFIQSHGEKVVIFAYHREVVRALAKELDVPGITSQTSEKRRLDAVERFQNDPGCRAIVISIMAESQGWRLDVARHAVFAEVCFTPKDQERAEGLLADPGRAHSVIAHYILAPDTLEDSFLQRIDVKRVVIQHSLGDFDNLSSHHLNKE